MHMSRSQCCRSHESAVKTKDAQMKYLINVYGMF